MINEEKIRRRNNKNNQNRYNKSSSNYYEWIERILQIPFEDSRKIIASLILSLYLVNIKKLSFPESYLAIKQWLEKCDSLEKLDNVGNFEYRIAYSLRYAMTKHIRPISKEKIKTDNNYRKLDNILKKKMILYKFSNNWFNTRTNHLN